VSTREEDAAAELDSPRPRARGGMTSLTRVRAGGVRLIRSRRGRIWMILAIAGPGVVAANAGGGTDNISVIVIAAE